MNSAASDTTNRTTLSSIAIELLPPCPPSCSSTVFSFTQLENAAESTARQAGPASSVLVVADTTACNTQPMTVPTYRVLGVNTLT